MGSDFGFSRQRFQSTYKYDQRIKKNLTITQQIENLNSEIETIKIIKS